MWPAPASGTPLAAGAGTGTVITGGGEAMDMGGAADDASRLGRDVNINTQAPGKVAGMDDSLQAAEA